MHVRATFDAAGLVTGFYTEFVYGPEYLPDGTLSAAYPSASVEITEAQYADLLANPGTRRWDGTTVATYVPPPVPVPTPTVTGNQWAFALSNMGLSSAWRIGVTKSKDSDQVRVALISRSTPLLASDPLLIRVAANAGTDTNGNSLISVPAVFTSAQGMPL